MSKQMTTKKTINFILVIAIAVTSSMQLVYGDALDTLVPSIKQCIFYNDGQIIILNPPSHCNNEFINNHAYVMKYYSDKGYHLKMVYGDFIILEKVVK